MLKAGTGRLIFAAGLLSLTVVNGGCQSTSDSETATASAEISAATKFSVAEYGVEASPRVTTSKVVPKGGGRAIVGKPYKVRGKWYTPKEDPDYNKAGRASWYGPNFHGRLTANGEVYDQYHLSAAHKTFPLPSYARVTNKKNGHSVVVRVNDRGPFSHGRIIDVSRRAAELLDMKREGVADVRVEYVGPAPVEGDDMPYLMASYRGSKDGLDGDTGADNSSVLLAMAEQDEPARATATRRAPPPQSARWGLPRPQLAALRGKGIFAGMAQAKPAHRGDRVGRAASMDRGTVNALVPPMDVQPAAFSLPETGPTFEQRPDAIAPMARIEAGDFHDIGLAYRGDRVVRHKNPFDWVLTGR
ncbi:septal ring lytic transglycosylase RlpA family protein [Pseudohoeflea coraliihabitans]|uniref:Endolytic peptidoglycan transglycosylase RlpA n=1 Tax=Pseudohoeflea coraliihabitans TaxID=2860393 RepID=A0ABS6WQZ3_9HYPH|nr:septal ring lytic transglycosylase RlpA family protein [Pseudohoeflea sp. DP4N28-3]